MRLGQRGWALLPVCAAFIYAVLLTSQARGVPDYDYWDMFTQLLDGDGFNITLATLYRTSNEHIVVLTKAFYLLNFALTGGDNLGLTTIACAFSLGVAVILARMLAITSRNGAEAFLLGAVAAIAAFTPMAAHNFFIGMSGVAWLGANMLAVIAAAAFMRGHSRGSIGWIAAAFCFAVLAGQFYSTGVVAMLAVGIQGFLLPRTRRIGFVFLVIGLGYLLLVYLMQKVPGYHGERTFDLAAILSFTRTFVGAGLTTSLPLAQLWGSLGLAVFVVQAIRFTRGAATFQPAGAFWIAIGCYALMNGGIAAIGRSAMGAEAAAMASRYASLPALFWVALLGLSLSLRRQDAGDQSGASANPLGVRGGILVACVAALTMTASAGPRIDRLLARSEGKPVAGLALALGVHDEPVILAHVTSAPSQIWAAEAGLRKIGQTPFNRIPECPPLGSRLEIPELHPTGPAMLGYVDGATDVGDGWFRVSGWAMDPSIDHPPLVKPAWSLYPRDCLSLVDAAGTVVGVGIGGEERADVAKHFGRDDTAYGWTAYARLEGPVRLYAAVRARDSGAWVRLPHSLDIP